MLKVCGICGKDLQENEKKFKLTFDKIIYIICEHCTEHFKAMEGAKIEELK